MPCIKITTPADITRHSMAVTQLSYTAHFLFTKTTDLDCLFFILKFPLPSTHNSTLSSEFTNKTGERKVDLFQSPITKFMDYHIHVYVYLRQNK